MKKGRVFSIAAITAAVCVCATVYANDWSAPSDAFSRGDLFLGPGLMTYPIGLYGAVDYAVHDAISAGGAAGYHFYFGANWVYHVIPIVARAAFHPFNLAVLQDKIPVRDKLDVYVGPAIGFGISTDRYTGDLAGIDGDTYVSFIAREYIGARYFLSDNFALFAEEGSGLGWINIGISMQLK